MKPAETAEGRRLAENDRGAGHWNRWGPYLSARAWGTVREDYSPDGTAWDYFPFDQAHVRAYRWNEDGLAGICDRHQLVCFALAFWNGKDPILKERPFGLSNAQGNHGEDVKDYWFYLDATPTHSYLKCDNTFQTDPHWKDLVLFYEYFHGDTGRPGRQPPDRLDRARREAAGRDRLAQRVRGVAHRGLEEP